MNTLYPQLRKSKILISLVFEAAATQNAYSNLSRACIINARLEQISVPRSGLLPKTDEIIRLNHQLKPRGNERWGYNRGRMGQMLDYILPLLAT
ncbi:MAG: hypothetical protein AAF927_04465 [Bacteroidota bacterium]